MVQRPCTQQFRTNDGDEIPFEKGEGGFGPSGSKWTTKELNWLAVCFQDDLRTRGRLLAGNQAVWPNR